MTDTSPLFCGTGANYNDGGTTAWSSPTNIQGDTTGTEASCLPGAQNAYSQLLRASGFGFSALPAGSTIIGITVEIERRASNNNRMAESAIYLMKALANVGANKGSGNWTTTKQFYTYSWSQAEVEAAGIAAADITNSGFGVSIKTQRTVSQTVTGYVSRVRITISYQEPTTPVAQTVTASYTVKTAIPKTVSPAYTSRQAISQTLTASYNIAASITPPSEGPLGIGDVLFDLSGDDTATYPGMTTDNPGTTTVPRLVSHQLAPSTTASVTRGYKNGSPDPTYGPDCEVVFQVNALLATTGHGVWVTVRWAIPTPSTMSFYQAGIEKTATGFSVTGYKKTDGANGVIGGTGVFVTDQAVSAGDWFAFTFEGTSSVACKAWKWDGSQWNQIGSTLTDTPGNAALQAAGLLGIEIDGISGPVRISGILGGTVVSTTPVSQTLTPSYTIRNAITKALSPAWTSKQAVTKTLTPAWTSRQEVTKPLAVSYGVKTLVQKAVAPSYAVRNLIQKAASPAYTVRQAVTKALSPAYTVKTVVSQTISPSYTVRQGIPKALTAEYQVAQTTSSVTKTLTPAWTSRQAISQQTAPSYTVRTAIAKALAPAYTIRLAVTKTVSPSYTVISQVTQTLSPAYAVRQTISKDLSPAYQVLSINSVSKQFVVNYNVRSVVSQTTQPSYVVKATLGKTTTPTYTVRTLLTKTLQPSYTVRGEVAQSVAPSYVVRGTTTKTLQPTYTVRAELTKQLSIAYSVAQSTTSVSQGLSVSYIVSQAISVPVSVAYSVIGPVLQTMTVQYRVVVIDPSYFLHRPVLLHAAAPSKPKVTRAKMVAMS
jgi:hypothetical protein